jgi:hypothetical protein
MDHDSPPSLLSATPELVGVSNSTCPTRAAIRGLLQVKGRQRRAGRHTRQSGHEVLRPEQGMQVN